MKITFRISTSVIIARSKEMRENTKQRLFMRNKRVSKIWRSLVTVTACVGIFAVAGLSQASATSCATNPDQQTCSNNYGVSESFFGTGGVDTCPTQGANAYCAKQSAGELTVGNVKGTAYQAQAGFNTDRLPYIEIVAQTPSVDVGVLSTSHPNVGTSQFYVKSYLSSGYVVQTWGAPPTYASHTFNTSSTPVASSVGTEQFGINLAANNVAGAVDGTGAVTPNFGATPSQDPDSSFSFGYVYHDVGSNQVYDTANSFKYTNGDIIAASNSSSGYTHYTISYLFNISAITPAGTYIMNQSLVATATF